MATIDKNSGLTDALRNEDDEIQIVFDEVPATDVNIEIATEHSSSTDNNEIEPVDAGGNTTETTGRLPTEGAQEIIADINNIVRLPAGTSLGDAEIEGLHLVLNQADGSKIILKNAAINLPTIYVGEVEFTQEVLAAAFQLSGINIAAGPDGATILTSGGNDSSGNNFQIPTPGIGEAGPVIDLLGKTELLSERLTQPELYYDVALRSELSIDKQVIGVFNQNDSTDPDGEVDAAGDVVEYQITVSNTGDQVLTNVVVTDPLTGLSETIPSLAPGESYTYTVYYTVTQADIDSNGGGDGDIDNTALADSDQTDPVEDTETVEVVQNPVLTIDKIVVSIHDPSEEPVDDVVQVTQEGLGVVDEVGDVIEYDIVVTNNGNQTLTDVVVTDPLTGLSETIASLAPGESYTYTVFYEVTQADIDSNATLEPDNTQAGFIDNTATADSNETDEVSDSESVPVAQSAALSIDKIILSVTNPDQTVDQETIVDQAGDVIDYAIEITNTGGVTLTNVVVTDPLTGGEIGTIASLAPGETQTLYTSYEVTQDDIESNATLEPDNSQAGYIDNTATADSDQTDEVNDSESVAVIVIPEVNAQIDDQCLDEDTPSGLTFSASVIDGTLTIITISGLDPSFAYDLSGLTTGTVTDNTATTGEIIIDVTGLDLTNFTDTFLITPPEDSDVDLGNVTVTADSISLTLHTDSHSDTGYIAVDANADAVTVDITDVSPSDGISFQEGETGTVSVDATFGDASDGSETHTLVLTAPAGFTIDALQGGLPAGVTVTGGAFGTDTVTLTFDTTAGITNFSGTFDVTNVSGAEPTTDDFTATVTATETTTGDVECDESDADNIATASDDVGVLVVNVSDPTASLSLPDQVDCLEEDSTTADAANQITVQANATGTNDQLTTIVIELPAGSIAAGWTIDTSGLETGGVTAGDISVVGDTITISNVNAASFTGTLGIAPPADSDVDLGTINVTATVVDTEDTNVTATGGGTLDVNVDANADAVTVDITDVSPSDGISFQEGETGTVSVDATFGDASDGSETHTLVLTAPAGFTIDALQGGLPAGVTVTGGAFGTDTVTLTFDTTAGITNFSGTFDVTNVSGAEPTTDDFTATVTATETTTGDVECDESDADNIATASDDVGVLVVNVSDPTASLSLPDQVDCLEEDSTTADAANQITVQANATGTNDQLTTIVIELPAGSIAAGWTIDTSGLETGGVTAGDISVVGDTITISNVNAASFTGTLGIAPPADSDVDLGTINVTATVVDTEDTNVTATGGGTLDVNVDANADAVTVDITDVSPSDGISFQEGETGTVSVDATFGDASDGSETHTLVLTAPAGFTIDALQGGLPAGVTVTGGAFGTDTVTLTFDTTAGITNFSGTFDVTNVSGAEPTTDDFTATVTATETTTGDVECDESDADNIATASDDVGVLVVNVSDPTASLSLPDQVDCLEEDSTTADAANQITVQANATGTNDQLTTIVIELPAGSIAAGWTIDTSGLETGGVTAGDISVVGDTITISNVNAASFTGTLGIAPPADSDVDLGTINVTATVVDTEDTNVTATGGGTLDVNVDANADAVTVDITDVSPSDGISFQEGETGTVSVDATFGDASDGSETHTLVLTAPAGFTIDALQGGLPAGVTVTGGAFGTDTVTLTFDTTAGITNFSGTFDVTNVSGAEPTTDDFTATVTATETTTGDVECDESDADNIATASDDVGVLVVNVSDPTASLSLPDQVDCLEEDSTTADAANQITVQANATGTNDQLTTIVIELPAGSIAAGWTIDTSGLETGGVTAGDISVVGDTITISNVNAASFTGTLGIAPPADSDVDLGTINVTATVVDTEDTNVTATGGGTLDVNVDANADAVTVDITDVSPSDGISFQEGETGTVSVDATFGDASDGSETHTLVLTAPAGFTIDALQGGLPAGVTVTGGAFGTDTVTLTFDTTAGITNFSGTFDVTNVSGAEPTTDDFTATVTATETTTGDVECDESDADNIATASDDVGVLVVNVSDPTASLSLPDQVDCLEEDSTTADAANQITVQANATGTNDQLTTIVIELPAGSIAAGWTIDTSGLETGGVTAGDISVVGDTITISNVNAASFTGTLGIAPPADSDVDLGTINVTATVVDTEDTNVTATGGGTLDVNVDANADAVTVDITDVSPSDGISFQEGETGTVSVDATFGDASDGSETHTLVLTAPAGFTIDALQGGLPAGVTVTGGAFGTDTVTLTFDTTAGITNFSGTFDVTNVSGAEPTTDDFTATVTATETTTGDVECDESDADNIATASDDVGVLVVNVSDPTASLSLPDQVDCLEEDSTTADAANQITVQANATGTNDQLTTIVIELPAGSIAAGWTIDTSGLETGGVTAGDISVVGDTITISNVNAASFTGTLGIAPPADSDVDLGTINVTATVVDTEDTNVTATGGGTLDVNVDANADAVTVDITDVSPSDGISFQEGETGTVSVDATFGDASDGSETHTLVLTAPAGFTIDALQGGLPAGVTVTGGAFGTDTVTLTFDTTAGITNFSGTFDVTNVSGAEPTTDDFTATVTATETTTGDVECDESDADNIATASDDVGVLVVNVSDPTASLSLPDQVDCLEEDSTTADAANQITVQANATGTNDQLTTIVIELPAGSIAAGWTIDTSGLETGGVTAGDISVVGDTITISNVNAASFTGTLGIAPPADSDVDLGTINVTATVVDTEDTNVTATGGGTLDVNVDAVADAPTNVSITVTDDPGDGDSSFSLGETGNLNVTADFSDTDGSESHILDIQLHPGFTADDLISGGSEIGNTGVYEGTYLGYDYTYDTNSGEILVDVGTDASVNLDIAVTAPGSGTLSGNLTFAVDVNVTETNTNLDPLLGDVECTLDNNSETVSASTGIPATQILDGAVVTNTNQNNQSAVLTFQSVVSPLDAYAAILLLNAQGQQGSLVADAGFNINSSHDFNVVLEDSGYSSGKIQFTDFSLEGVEITPPSGGNIALSHSLSGNTDQAIVAVINPDADGGTNIDGVYSTNGGNGPDTIGDPTANEPNYLYGYNSGDTLNGSDDADILNGGDGVDTLNGNGGNDILVFDAGDSHNGGDGFDILRIDDGANFNTERPPLLGPTSGFSDNDVDLVGEDITGIEAILITEEASPDATLGTDLEIDAQDILDFTDGDNELYIIGSEGDTVLLSDEDGTLDADFTDTGNDVISDGGQVFSTYTATINNVIVTLHVDDDITVI